MTTINFQDNHDPEGDYTEDFAHENGNYFHICKLCSKPFGGHKRRHICKVCMSKTPDTIREDTFERITRQFQETMKTMQLNYTRVMAAMILLELKTPPCWNDLKVVEKKDGKVFFILDERNPQVYNLSEVIFNLLDLS